MSSHQSVYAERPALAAGRALGTDAAVVGTVLAEFGLSLAELGRLTGAFGLPAALPDDALCRRVALAGERLCQRPARCVEGAADLGLFLIAWAAECMAAGREDDGVEGCGGEVLIDCLEELRAFDLANQVIADRAAYRIRRDVGRRALALLLDGREAAPNVLLARNGVDKRGWNTADQMI